MIACLMTPAAAWAEASETGVPPAGPVGNPLKPRARKSHLKLVATGPAEAIQPGRRFEVILSVELEPGWHIYGFENAGVLTPARVELAEKGPFRLAGRVTAPPPLQKPAISLDIPGYDYYEGKVEFRLTVEAAGDLKPGEALVHGKLSYQECTETSCLLPANQEFAVPVRIEATPVPAGASEVAEPKDGGVIAGPGGVRPPAVKETVTSSPWEGGFLAYLGLAIGAGLLTLLTPCVFPLIPVTISYF
ncbi:MAG: hypothetical protein HYU43_04125, partial [Armatimonadetes bacterium]|nr:hypothetical protein [Armatimonadota bacterium]